MEKPLKMSKLVVKLVPLTILRLLKLLKQTINSFHDRY